MLSRYIKRPIEIQRALMLLVVAHHDDGLAGVFAIEFVGEQTQPILRLFNTVKDAEGIGWIVVPLVLLHEVFLQRAVGHKGEGADSPYHGFRAGEARRTVGDAEHGWHIDE